MIIGIDIGTSYSSAAIIKNGRPEPVKVGATSYSIPSAVYNDGGTLLIGSAAVAKSMEDPALFKPNFKRDFGTDKPYILGDMEITPDEIYVKYFERFIESVKNYTGQDVSMAYITHPVGYSAKKKQRLEKAAAFAKLKNVELVDEPTAAALSYFYEYVPKIGETLLVYDLGGGTFDLTLVEMTEKGFRLLTDPVGDVNFGGIDFDKILYADIVAEFSKKNDLTEALKKDRFRLAIQEEAVNAKIHLSGDKSATIIVPYIHGDTEYLEYKITREYFNKLIEPRVRSSCALIEKIAKNAGLTPAQIDKVLCVGGSTRIPFVKTCVEETVCKTALQKADPELAICLGAVSNKESIEIWKQKESESKELKLARIEAERKKEEEFARIEAARLKEEELARIEAERKKEEEFARIEAERKKEEEFARIEAERLKEEELARIESERIENERTESEKRYAHGLYEKGIYYKSIDDYEQAIKCFLEAAEFGIAEAQYELAIMYDTGSRVTQSDSQAEKWFFKAAKQGHIDAQCNLAFMCVNGRCAMQSDIEIAEWCRIAAEQGYIWAQYNLASMYENGYGVAKSDEDAAEWYRKVVEQEFITTRTNTLNRSYCKSKEEMIMASQYRLAVLYQNGCGVDKNDTETAKLFRKSTKKGCAEAQFALGRMYAAGYGVEQNDAEAAAWYHKSANQGFAAAKAHLGYMYAKGRGVRQNKSKALRWFRKAPEQALLLYKSIYNERMRNECEAIGRSYFSKLEKKWKGKKLKNHKDGVYQENARNHIKAALLPLLNAMKRTITDICGLPRNALDSHATINRKIDELVFPNLFEESLTKGSKLLAGVMAIAIILLAVGAGTIVFGAIGMGVGIAIGLVAAILAFIKIKKATIRTIHKISDDFLESTLQYIYIDVLPVVLGEVDALFDDAIEFKLKGK